MEFLKRKNKPLEGMKLKTKTENKKIYLVTYLTHSIAIITLNMNTIIKRLVAWIKKTKKIPFKYISLK